jgi:ribosomal protein S27AE
MEKESEEECPICGVLTAKHSGKQIQQCVKSYKEQHGIGKKESEESITVNFTGPDGGTYQGTDREGRQCPSCGVLIAEHSREQLRQCVQRFKEQHGIGKPKP